MEPHSSRASPVATLQHLHDALFAQNGSFVFVNYPVPEDDDDHLASGSGGDAGVPAAGADVSDTGGFVIRDGTTAPPPRAAIPGRELTSLKAIREDAERRKVLLLTLESGAVGNLKREKLEISESASVGQLKEVAGRHLGIDAVFVGLARGRADVGSPNAQRMFGTSDAKLTVDINGPRLEGSDRISAVLFAYDTRDGSTGTVRPVASGGAVAGPGAARGVAAPAGPRAISWDVPPAGGSDDGDDEAADAPGGTADRGASAAAGAASGAGGDDAGDGDVDLSVLPADLRPVGAERMSPAALRKYLKDNAEFIAYQTNATHRQLRIDMNPFLNQNLSVRRLGWLFGRVTAAAPDTYAAQGAGKVVDVEVIYEPTQLGLKNRILLGKDETAPFSEMITRTLGLVKVGWLFTAPFRGKVENVLTASEVLLAAAQQAVHPHFMTAAFTFEQRQDAGTGRTHIFRSTTAWQLSEQCIKLFKAGQLYRDDGDDAFVIRSRKSVMASDPDDPMQRVRATTKFHTSYLVSPAGIQAVAPEDTLLSSQFPVTTRRSPSGDVMQVSTERARKAIFGLRVARGQLTGAVTAGTIRETMLARISDFNFLLWLCKVGPTLPYPVTLSEVAEMCGYVRDLDAAGAASFRFKLMAALGAGWLCPLTEAKGGYDDVRESPEDLRDHIARTFGNDGTPVVDPLESVRAVTRADRERRRGFLLTRLREALGRERRDSMEDDAGGMAGMPHASFLSSHLRQF